jgi:hypothetical protein
MVLATVTLVMAATIQPLPSLLPLPLLPLPLWFPL